MHTSGVFSFNLEHSDVVSFWTQRVGPCEPREADDRDPGLLCTVIQRVACLTRPTQQ
jgi:hypothetical protein